MPFRSSKKAVCFEMAPVAGKCYREIEAEVLGAAAFAILKRCAFTFCHKSLGTPVAVQTAQLLTAPRAEVPLFSFPWLWLCLQTAALNFPATPAVVTPAMRIQ